MRIDYLKLPIDNFDNIIRVDCVFVLIDSLHSAIFFEFIRDFTQLDTFDFIRIVNNLQVVFGHLEDNASVFAVVVAD